MVNVTEVASATAADPWRGGKPLGRARFSVVIPAFNRAGLITRTLDSVFSQTHPAHEVIVVDNCSTDATVDVVRSHPASARIKLIVHSRNLERAAARNTGMECATGDFVTFLDSDDLMYERNLRAAADFAATHSKPRVFHNLYELVDSDRQLLHRYRFPQLRDWRRAIVEGNFLSCIGVFLHRDVYTRYSFDTSPILTGSEDWELWIRILARYPVSRIPEVNSGIVHHGDRTVRHVDLDQLEQRMQYLAARLRADPELHAAYQDHIDRFIGHALVYQATMANAAGYFGDALRYLRRAATTHRSVITSPKFARVLQIALLRQRVAG